MGEMQDWSPSSAAWAATWEIEVGFEVLCDCTFFMALISVAVPPAYPMRQPVIANDFETPCTETVRSASSGHATANGVNSVPP